MPELTTGERFAGSGDRHMPELTTGERFAGSDRAA